MQYLNHWPDMTDLSALPGLVSQDVFKLLLEPFENASMAKAFWEETSTTLIILEPNDCIQQLKRDEAWQNIEFALSYPEYTSH